MKKSLFLLSLALINPVSVNAADNEKLHIVTVPGQNGEGTHRDYVRRAFNCLQDNQLVITEVTTPTAPWYIDFGQNNCQQHVTDALQNNSDKSLFYLASQGTTTGFLYAIKNPEKVGGIIAEAPMISPNSAITHTASQVLPSSSSSSCESSFPTMSRIAFWSYSPTGEKPIDFLDKIPDVPTYIMHDIHDPQVPVSNALSLYYALKNNGHTNVYLSLKNSPWPQHIILRQQEDNERIKRMFIDKEILINENHDDLMQKGEIHYEELIRLERNVEYVERATGAAVVAGLGYLVYNKIFQS